VSTSGFDDTHLIVVNREGEVWLHTRVELGEEVADAIKRLDVEDGLTVRVQHPRHGHKTPKKVEQKNCEGKDLEFAREVRGIGDQSECDPCG